MAIIKCKMCGGDLDLTEGASTAVCEFCGSVQTVPVPDDEKKLTLFARANRLRAACEFDKSAGIYEAIVADFPEEAEAYWGLVLCKYGIEYVDDPQSGKKIPTCHRSSFDSILEDSDFEQTLENADAMARKVYREEAKQIEELRKGIISVSSNEQPYDVFICYKETDENGERTLDSVLAQDVYDALKDKGYRVFFSRISLEDKLGVEYEPYIFAALNSAKIMLAFGTDYEYFNAVWVKNEWSRFLKLMAKDKDKHLIPCYKGIDAYDMPKEFARLQAQDLGKVGAIQDLLRGVEKLLPRQKNTTVIQERVVVGGSGDNKIASLLDRGNMALEDGDWAKADSFFEDVLNNDSKNAQAYLGKTLAMEKCRTIDAFVRKRKDASQFVKSRTLQLEADQAHIAKMVETYQLPGYTAPEEIRRLYGFDLSYPSDAPGRRQQYREEETYWANHKQLSRAEKFAVGAVAENLAAEKKALFAALSQRVKSAEAAEAAAKAELQERYARHLQKADQQAEKLYSDGLARREKDYGRLLQIGKNSEDPEELAGAAASFAALGDYKDSKDLAEHCRKRAEDERAKLAAEAERQKALKIREQKAQQEKLKRVGIIAAAAVAIVIALVLLVTEWVIPGSRYAAAEALLAEGKYMDASHAFAALEGFSDSEEMVRAISGIDLLNSERYDDAVIRMLENGVKVTAHYDKNYKGDAETVEYPGKGSFSGLLEPTSEGYRFVSWKLIQWQYQTGGNFELAFQAVWTDGYIIEYELDGGQAENPTQYHKDGEAVVLRNPTKKGYTFIGWTGTGLDGPTKDVTIPAGSYGDRKYTATWQANEYTFTLDANGGTVSSASLSAAYDSQYALPTPQREYYTFAGWYDGDSRYADGTWRKDANVTLTAKWTPVSYTLTYYLDGGTNAEQNVTAYTVESADISLSEPTKKGYKFLGWYSDSGYLSKVTGIPAGSTGNRDLYAKWEIIHYTITYQMNGGSVSGGVTTFTVDDLPITLPAASKSNMMFLNWGKNTFDGEIVTEITDIGDITLVACFLDPNLQLKWSSSLKGYQVTGYSGTSTSVVIPAYYEGKPVTGIAEAAFRYNRQLVSLTMPNTITTIGDEAFKSCEALRKIVWSNSLESIGEWCFWYCQSLTSLSLPETLKRIDGIAFAHCTGLTSVTLPDSLTTLGGQAFSGCSSLRTVKLGTGLRTIDHNTFAECTSLNSIIIPDGVITIKYDAFKYCSSLTKLIIPSSVTTVETAFYGCSKLTFYCRASVVPSGWASGWNSSRPVVWGYTGN